MVRRELLPDERGQATTEYILLLAIVVGLFGIALRGLKKAKIAERIVAPIAEQFASAYRYGHPKAKGYDDGGPRYHPRIVGGDHNFRIFINPVQR